ncbi:MAG: phosphodiesterase [Jatrophihabitantaceae bacterium]
MLIAQLSDSHLRLGPLAGEAASHLHRALGRVLGLRPRPDCVVITGDIVDNGTTAEYQAFLAVADGYPLPIHLAAGNHDDARTMVNVFGKTGYLGGGESAYYTVEYPDLRIVILNSAVPGSMAGQLDEAQLSWLDTELAVRADVSTLVCLHHPPIDVGMPFLDSIKLANAEALAAVLAKYSNVQRILAGHVHRAIFGSFAGSTVAIAPSTFRQAALELCGEGSSGYVHEPPGLLLHLAGSGRCTTHVVPTMHAGGPVGYY